MYRDVRIAEAGNKLAFRYDPVSDLVEVSIRGQRYEVCLSQYRSLSRRLTFDADERIIEEQHIAEWPCR